MYTDHNSMRDSLRRVYVNASPTYQLQVERQVKWCQGFHTCLISFKFQLITSTVTYQRIEHSLGFDKHIHIRTLTAINVNAISNDYSWSGISDKPGKWYAANSRCDWLALEVPGSWPWCGSYLI